MKKFHQTFLRQELVHFLDEIQRDYEYMLDNWLPKNFKLALGTEQLSNTHAALEERILRHIMTKAEAVNPKEGHSKEQSMERTIFYQTVVREFREAIQLH